MSGFTKLLEYIASDNNRENNTEEKKQCKRKIICFNPRYSMNARTNIGKPFLKLTRNHFPNGNLSHKTFNKNVLKVIFSCMGNMTSIISSHNRTILNPHVSVEYWCNCKSRNECPLQNKCLTPKVVYHANIENDINDENKFCVGISETSFKERFRNHKKELNYVKCRNSTELSKYIWQLKDFTPKVS